MRNECSRCAGEFIDPEKVKERSATTGLGSWVAMGNTAFSRLILWSGVFPPDYPWESGTEQMKSMRIDVALGTEDDFFDDSLLKTTASVLEEKAVSFTTHSFQGGHAIDTDLLQRLLD